MEIGQKKFKCLNCNALNEYAGSLPSGVTCVKCGSQKMQELNSGDTVDVTVEQKKDEKKDVELEEKKENVDKEAGKGSTL